MFPKSRKISTYVKKPSLRKNDVESFLLRYSQNSKMGFLTLGILEMSFWTFYPQKSLHNGFKMAKTLSIPVQ